MISGGIEADSLNIIDKICGISLRRKIKIIRCTFYITKTYSKINVAIQGFKNFYRSLL